MAPVEREEALEAITAAGGSTERFPGDEAMARALLLVRAKEVRCTRCCTHSPRIAILDRGVECCMKCRFQFADAEARGDGRCDTCDAEGEELQPVRSRLQGGVVLPTGDVQPTVELVAKVCPDCLDLLESVPPSSQAAAWN